MSLTKLAIVLMDNTEDADCYSMPTSYCFTIGEVIGELKRFKFPDKIKTLFMKRYEDEYHIELCDTHDTEGFIYTKLFLSSQREIQVKLLELPVWMREPYLVIHLENPEFHRYLPTEDNGRGLGSYKDYPSAHQAVLKFNKEGKNSFIRPRLLTDLDKMEAFKRPLICSPLFEEEMKCSG